MCVHFTVAVMTGELEIQCRGFVAAMYRKRLRSLFFFFFQAEDGIRDRDG